MFANVAVATAGGAFTGNHYSSVIWGNRAPSYPNWRGGNLSYCCTTPLPSGPGNIASDPLFISSNDFHLALDSPCIDAGTNALGPESVDLDRLPRTVNRIVDMGPYEYGHPDTDGDAMPDRWEWQNGGNLTNLLPMADTDEDGSLNLHEYLAGTSATNPASCLRFKTIDSDDGKEIILRWQSADGRCYRLYRATNLEQFPLPLRTGIEATPPMNTETDRTAASEGPWYYRVELE